ncbi:Resolvase domain-containing protein [Clostridiaceae bacterium JG1575]|nr:Resolvase domain-containing protein [Clostridiaceae bacterium JG1575]
MGRKITKIEAVTPMPKRKRVAAYARVSCGKDEMLHSLAAQVSFYSDLIQSRSDWEFAGVFADEAETGTKDSRPEFQRLIAKCQSGQVDMVITKSISRFARNTVTLLETVRDLKERGIDVYFEEQNIHTESADGELMLTILASYAQEESRSVSENCKWRYRNGFKEGKPSNYIRVYGYDYKNGRLTVIPEEAEVVRMIFTDYLGGMGRNAIMKKLTRLAVPTKTGGHWSESTVMSMLSNEKYIGDMMLQKGYVADHITKRIKPNRGELPMYYVEGTHEAIIDKETFEAVQAEIARRSALSHHPRTKTFSEFSGMIHCARCGANFCKKVNCSGTKYAKVTWACRTFTYRGKRECPAKRIPEDILKAKCAEVLGLAEYDLEAFKSQIAAITVPDDGVLIFEFQDHTHTTVMWENPSRRESWTDDMKAVARERAKEGHANG